MHMYEICPQLLTHPGWHMLNTHTHGDRCHTLGQWAANHSTWGTWGYSALLKGTLAMARRTPGAVRFTNFWVGTEPPTFWLLDDHSNHCVGRPMAVSKHQKKGWGQTCMQANQNQCINVIASSEETKLSNSTETTQCQNLMGQNDSTYPKTDGRDMPERALFHLQSFKNTLSQLQLIIGRVSVFSFWGNSWMTAILNQAKWSTLQNNNSSNRKRTTETSWKHAKETLKHSTDDSRDSLSCGENVFSQFCSVRMSQSDRVKKKKVVIEIWFLAGVSQECFKLTWGLSPQSFWFWYNWELNNRVTRERSWRSLQRSLPQD